jgi:hypothetical protein
MLCRWANGRRAAEDELSAELGEYIDMYVADRVSDGMDPDVTVEVSADYFDTLGIDLEEGRSFRAAEDGVVVNQSFVDRYWPAGGAIGRRVRFRPTADAHGPWYTIVGVSAGLSRLLTGYLFEVTPVGPAVFAGVTALFVVVALVANYLPSRRSATIDPMTTLRCE